jgi:hypothetical protein
MKSVASLFSSSNILSAVCLAVLALLLAAAAAGRPCISARCFAWPSRWRHPTRPRNSSSSKTFRISSHRSFISQHRATNPIIQF